jgi:hypothetical protein
MKLGQINSTIIFASLTYFAYPQPPSPLLHFNQQKYIKAYFHFFLHFSIFFYKNMLTLKIPTTLNYKCFNKFPIQANSSFNFIVFQL